MFHLTNLEFTTITLFSTKDSTKLLGLLQQKKKWITNLQIRRKCD